MSDIEWLQIPVTEVEIGNLLMGEKDVQLTQWGKLIVRRLAFEQDRLRAELAAIRAHEGVGASMKTVHKDVPRRFFMPASHPMAIDLGIGGVYGVFFPPFGVSVVVSENRGIDELVGGFDGLEWLDEAKALAVR